jgi:ADP-ribose pyrophosphatase YjhB (NUDIX family)
VRARFCDRCGTRLDERPPTTCRGCGAEQWIDGKACANLVVLDDDGRILLVRRAHAPWLDRWSAPGGFCNELEHPLAAAEREVLEETGLRARVTGFLGIWVDRYADDQADEDADVISVVYYLGRPLGGEPAPRDGECSEIGWFPLDSLPAPLAAPFEPVVEAVRAAVEAGRTETPLPDAPGDAGQAPAQA